MILRAPRVDEFPALSALCLRSKAHWGYDADFMAACIGPLTLRDEGWTRIADLNGSPLGVVQISVDGDRAELSKLFVDPAAMGLGAGRALFDAARRWAAQKGARSMRIVSDPGAVPFYQRMGAVVLSEQVESEAIPGRFLPVLIVPLDPPDPAS